MDSPDLDSPKQIQLILDLTSRIDERTKMLIDRQKELEDSVDNLLDMQNIFIQRLSAIECDLKNKEIQIDSLQKKQNNLKNIVDENKMKIEAI